MAGSIVIVGLAGRERSSEWSTILAGRTILARHRLIAERLLPEMFTVAHDYDELFDGSSLQGVEEAIASDVVQRSEHADIAFLIPGPGWLGDAIVARLSTTSAVTIAPSAEQPVLDAQTHVVDALVLAQAQEQAPFDAGSHPLEPTLPTTIYNLHGQRVIELAIARLRRVYGIDHFDTPDEAGTLRIAARGPLDSPPSFAALEYITARLRRPDGCPWDRKQTHDSMLDDFASEVGEYAEAVEAADWPHAAEELGDVLLNVMMQVQIGIEAGHFAMDDVLRGINAKLVRRHPHVFAGVEASTPADVLAVWNSVKAQEKAASSK